MRFSLTDQFLWNLYDFFERMGMATDFIFENPRSFKTISRGFNNPRFASQRTKNRQQFDKIIYYLKKNNFIKVKDLQGKRAIILTKKGIDKAIKASFKLQENSQKRRKDGKWIMIIFDIPQSRKKDRWLMRSILKNLGYKMFQQSVWVNPYDVFKKTEEALQYNSLDSYVKIFLIEEI